MPLEKMELKIQNSTICFQIGLPKHIKNLDLELLSHNISNFMHIQNQRFHRCIYKMQQPYKATFLIYSNGKVVVVGFKYIDQLDNLLAEFMYLIGETLCKFQTSEILELKLKKVCIKNIVYSGNFGEKIDLKNFYNNIRLKCIYEPLIYPALYCFPDAENTKVFIALFRSGKFFITGETSNKKICKIHNLLQQFSKTFYKYSYL